MGWAPVQTAWRLNPPRLLSASGWRRQLERMNGAQGCAQVQFCTQFVRVAGTLNRVHRVARAAQFGRGHRDVRAHSKASWARLERVKWSALPSAPVAAGLARLVQVGVTWGRKTDLGKNSRSLAGADCDYCSGPRTRLSVCAIVHLRTSDEPQMSLARLSVCLLARECAGGSCAPRSRCFCIKDAHRTRARRRIGEFWHRERTQKVSGRSQVDK